MSDFWLKFSNGKKEQLGETKSGVRKDQVDKKFHNLFDAYDVNKDGTLESNELEVINKGLINFAGADKTLDSNENKKLSSIFAKEAGIEDADFQGFMKAVADASAEIVSSKETPTADGGKEVVTTYKDGTKETIAYYPNGDYKFKHTEKHEDTTTTTYTMGGKQYTASQIESQIKKDYQTYKNAKPKPQFGELPQQSIQIIMSYKDFKESWMINHKVNINTNRSKIDIDNVELSEFAKQDVAVRDFLLSYFVETHKATQDALDTMGILDDIGAAINAGAGETWNACKNIYNKYFGDGTQEDYQNFYELVNKFKPNYDKAIVTGGRLETMRNHPELYFKGFENEVKNYDIQKGFDFQQKTEQYQNAQILNSRIELLKKAKSEIEAFQREQDALIYAPAQNEGLNPGSHIVTANKLLLQYCNNDQEAVDLLLNGSISSREGNAQSAAQVQALLDETQTMLNSVLNGETLEKVKSEYNEQYKEMYGVDFVPDALDEKIMDAKATGGMVKIAAITIVSILITKSPAMVNVMGAAAGSEAAAGASAAFIRTLVSKYGQTVVQQGIKFAMTSGTLATDVGLTLLNQVTDNRDGVQWNEVGESTASAAKYIYFGAYIGSPLAQAVAGKIGQLGLAGKIMEGGTKTTTGAITTTTISGEKLVQNFMKSGQSLLAKGGALATEIGAFTGLELATGDIDLATAAEEQTKMQLELKLMHNLFEYMLGGKAHTAMQKAKFDAAIEKSGVKDWTIKEMKSPSGTKYAVEMNGVPIGVFKDVNMLASAMMGRVNMAYAEVQTENLDREPQTKELKENIETQPVDKLIDLNEALDNATSREDFVAIRDEIKKMPQSEEKTALMQKYQTKYREWSTNSARPDIRMEYKGENDLSETIFTKEECIDILKKIGLTDNEISAINETHIQLVTNVFKLALDLRPELFETIPHSELVEAYKSIIEEASEFSTVNLKYLNEHNFELLKEVMIFDEEQLPLDLVEFNMPELYRVAKYYYDTTGEKLEFQSFKYSNVNFKGSDAKFPTNKQIDIGLKMNKAGLWDDSYILLLHANQISVAEDEITDDVIATMKNLLDRAKAADMEITNLIYFLNKETIDAVKKIKEYDKKSPIDFTEYEKMQNSKYIDVEDLLFNLELKEANIPDNLRQNIIFTLSTSFSRDKGSQIKYIKYCLDNNLLLDYDMPGSILLNISKNINRNNIELAKKLSIDKDFPKEEISSIISEIKAKNNDWMDGFVIGDDDNTQLASNISIDEQKALLAEKLCTDKSINCPHNKVKYILSKYVPGSDDIIYKMIKNGVLEKYPELTCYKTDCWENIIKRDLLNLDNILQFPKGSLPYDATLLIETYARTEDENMIKMHQQLLNDALANKDILKSGMDDITDEEICATAGCTNAIRTIDLIGLGNTEAAFPLMLEEFREFVNEVGGIKLSNNNKELILQKLNPQNSQKYKALYQEIVALKKLLNETVGEENLVKIQDLQKKKARIDEQIKQLKQGENAETPEVKQQIKDLQKQSKLLGGQAQAIYYQGENANQVKEIMKDISTKTKDLKNFVSENSGLEPQEVVTKMRVLSALTEISSDEEIAIFIDMIKPSSKENDAIWNDAVNKKIFQKLGVEYDEVLSQKLDLIHCKYISKLFISSEEFFDNMKILVDVLKNNPNLSVEQAIDQMPQNIETKKIFESLGFNYEKFTKVDKNSYTSVQIELNAEEAKQAAIHNLEEDLNDALFQSIPKEVTEPIFKHLEEKLGVTFVKSQKDNWEGDGFDAGSSEYYRLYRNGTPITFEDMDAIVSLIKKEILSNNFWTTKNRDSNIENARGTMYTHLIKMRTQEVDNATSIKTGETADIEVRKTDMYDVKKALGLGNDAQCCTALGRNFNEWSAPTYIMNKSIGAIELTDQGNFVGNTMIYLAYVDGKPALVLDNIELKTKYQNNDKIRDTFVEYAKKLCEEIGQLDLPIFAGPNRHKLNMDIYPKSEHSMEIIGNSGDQSVYVDHDASSHIIGNGEIVNIQMYKLR